MIKIEINNTTRYPVNKKVIQRTVDKCADFLKFRNLDADLSIAFVNDKEMRKMNKVYRGVDMPTDVLSFGSLAGDKDFATAGTGKRENEGTREGTNNNQKIRAEAAVSGEGLRSEKSPRPATSAGRPPLKKGVAHGYAEIIISYETAKKQAGENKISINKEMQKLLIHGLLHLSGFDHEIDKDAREMDEAERKLLDC